MRLPVQQRNSLNSYLEYLGEVSLLSLYVNITAVVYTNNSVTILSLSLIHMQTWGGAQNGFGLAHCCQNVTLDTFPETSTSVYFEYQPVNVSLTPQLY